MKQKFKLARRFSASKILKFKILFTAETLVKSELAFWDDPWPICLI